MIYNHQHNSNCLVSLGEGKWIGPLKFFVKEPSYHLIPIEPEKWHNLGIRQISNDIKIAPSRLNGRIFVDQNEDFDKILDYRNWQPRPIFIEHLIKRLRDYLKESNKSICDDLCKLGNLFRQSREDNALLCRLQEYDNMNDLQQESIDAIVQLLRDMEPFAKDLEKAKTAILTQVCEEAKLKAEQELEDTHREIQKSENLLSDLKIEVNKLEKHLEAQHSCMTQTLDKFERSLSERLSQLTTEPSSVLAEVLANDAFLQLVLGQGKRQLALPTHPTNDTAILKVSLTPEVKRGPVFETAEALLNKYHTRLSMVDLDNSLAVWTTAIALAGLIPIFKGSKARRALDVFANHLTYGRYFDLPLSPEMISIERLFTVGRLDETTLGILDNAILSAATHRDALFMLVLEGLDRAPTQYFLDTLLRWYTQGLLDLPSDTLLAQHMKWLRTRHGLVSDAVGWPPNLLLIAIIDDLADGFPVSSTALSKIMEVKVESQGNCLDDPPASLEKIACKNAGEITVDQWNNWREFTKNQDISSMKNFIISLHKNEQPDIVKQEAALWIFAALRTLEEPQDNAIEIIQKNLLGK